MRTTNKRTTNNDGNSSPKDPNDDVYYAVYDTDTGEYLTDWDTDQDSGEVQFQQWQEINFDGEEVLSDIRKFDTAVLSYSRKSAERLLVDVATNLCERFPDEQINLQVHELTVKIQRSVEVQEVGYVQTFGEDEAEDIEEEDEDDWEAPPTRLYRKSQPETAFYTPLEEKPPKTKKEKKSTKRSR